MACLFVYSAGQLPDLRLDQPSRRGGELIHPADGSQILPVDSTGVGNVGVLPHKDGGHPDTPVSYTHLEHQIILNAGAYDVSAKLQNDALIVDDGWIQRKNPGVIVKVVERSVLGSGVSSTRQAETVCGALKAREGWSGLDAVRNGRVILLSEELLSGQARRTGAAVLLAKAMYPSLFSDTDGGEMCIRDSCNSGRRSASLHDKITI